MSLTVEQVKKIAHLARLKITEDDANVYTGELNKIFSWIEQLSEVDTSNVEPLAAVHDHPVRMREDKVTDGGQADAVVATTEHAKYNYFVVPKVIE